MEKILKTLSEQDILIREIEKITENKTVKDKIKQQVNHLARTTTKTMTEAVQNEISKRLK